MEINYNMTLLQNKHTYFALVLEKDKNGIIINLAIGTLCFWCHQGYNNAELFVGGFSSYVFL